MKPTRRYSYHVFLAILACAALPQALPYLKDVVPSWVYAILAVVGIVAQHLKQEVPTNERKDQSDENP